MKSSMISFLFIWLISGLCLSSNYQYQNHSELKAEVIKNIKRNDSDNDFESETLMITYFTSRLSNFESIHNADHLIRYAACYGYTNLLETIKNFCSHKNQPFPADLTFERGLSLLTYSVAVGNKPLFDFLLNNGANPDISMEKGKNPLYVAKITCHKDLYDALIAKGASTQCVDELNRALQAHLPQLNLDFSKPIPDEHVDPVIFAGIKLGIYDHCPFLDTMYRDLAKSTLINSWLNSFYLLLNGEKLPLIIGVLKEHLSNGYLFESENITSYVIETLIKKEHLSLEELIKIPARNALKQIDEHYSSLLDSHNLKFDGLKKIFTESLIHGYEQTCDKLLSANNNDCEKYLGYLNAYFTLNNVEISSIFFGKLDKSMVIIEQIKKFDNKTIQQSINNILVSNEPITFFIISFLLSHIENITITCDFSYFEEKSKMCPENYSNRLRHKEKNQNFFAYLIEKKRYQEALTFMSSHDSEENPYHETFIKMDSNNSNLLVLAAFTKDFNFFSRCWNFLGGTGINRNELIKDKGLHEKNLLEIIHEEITNKDDRQKWLELIGQELEATTPEEILNDLKITAEAKGEFLELPNTNHMVELSFEKLSNHEDLYYLAFFVTFKGKEQKRHGTLLVQLEQKPNGTLEFFPYNLGKGKGPANISLQSPLKAPAPKKAPKGKKGAKKASTPSPKAVFTKAMVLKKEHDFWVLALKYSKNKKFSEIIFKESSVKKTPTKNKESSHLNASKPLPIDSYKEKTHDNQLLENAHGVYTGELGNHIFQVNVPSLGQERYVKLTVHFGNKYESSNSFHETFFTADVTINNGFIESVLPVHQNDKGQYKFSNEKTSLENLVFTNPHSQKKSQHREYPCFQKQGDNGLPNGLIIYQNEPCLSLHTTKGDLLLKKSPDHIWTESQELLPQEQVDDGTSEDHLQEEQMLWENDDSEEDLSEGEAEEINELLQEVNDSLEMASEKTSPGKKTKALDKKTPQEVYFEFEGAPKSEELTPSQRADLQTSIEKSQETELFPRYVKTGTISSNPSTIIPIPKGLNPNSLLDNCKLYNPNGSPEDNLYLATEYNDKGKKTGKKMVIALKSFHESYDRFASNATWGSFYSSDLKKPRFNGTNVHISFHEHGHNHYLNISHHGLFLLKSHKKGFLAKATGSSNKRFYLLKKPSNKQKAKFSSPQALSSSFMGLKKTLLETSKELEDLNKLLEGNRKLQENIASSKPSLKVGNDMTVKILDDKNCQITQNGSNENFEGTFGAQMINDNTVFFYIIYQKGHKLITKSQKFCLHEFSAYF